MKSLLIEVSRVGLEGLSLFSKLKMLYLLKKNRMKLSDGVALYGKYVGGWGDSATTFRIEGYRGSELLCTQSCQQSFEQRLDVQVDDVDLLEDETYDTTRCVIRCLDEGDNVLNYASDTLNIETEGPVDVIGPKSISLVGGGIAFWVRTAGVSGEAIVRIRNERFGVVEQRIQVSKQSEASIRHEKSEQAVCLE